MRVKLQSKVIYDVFLSYSRKDANIADEIYKVLQKNNIKVFIDTEDIGGARDFAEIISENILSSKIFLCIASSNYYKAKWALDEIAYAKDNKQRESIYVYIIDNSEMPRGYNLSTAAINRRLMSNTPIEPNLVDDIKLLLNNQKILIKHPMNKDNNDTSSHIDIGINTKSFYSNIGFNFTTLISFFKRFFKKKGDKISIKDSNKSIPD